MKNIILIVTVILSLTIGGCTVYSIGGEMKKNCHKVMTTQYDLLKIETVCE